MKKKIMRKEKNIIIIHFIIIFRVIAPPMVSVMPTSQLTEFGRVEATLPW